MERKNITLDEEMIGRIYALRCEERYRQMTFTGIVREMIAQGLALRECLTEEGRDKAYVALDHAAKMLNCGAVNRLSDDIRENPNAWRVAFENALFIVRSCGVKVTALDENSEATCND